VTTELIGQQQPFSEKSEHVASVCVDPSQLLVPDDAARPETDNVSAIRQSEVEMIVQNSAHTSNTQSQVDCQQESGCSFFDLCKIPTRERRATKRRAVNFHLTSESHIDFVKDSLAKKKPKHTYCRQASNDGAENTVEPRKVITTKRRGSRLAQKTAQPQRKRFNKTKTTPTTALQKSAEDKTPCIYCEIPYNESRVKWRQCTRCFKWACADCACVGKKERSFQCEICA